MKSPGDARSRCSQPRHSCLYVGWVRHRRAASPGRTFRYPMRMALLDLDEVPGLFPSNGCWRLQQGAPVVFRPQDHRYGRLGINDHLDMGPQDAVELKQRILARIAEAGGRRDLTRVSLLTMPRMLGFAFNPVTFAYAYADNGELAAVASEITNMPWLERATVVVPVNERGLLSKIFAKPFHVSPFLAMQYQWAWQLTKPGKNLGIHMRNLNEQGLAFDATLALTRLPWTAGQRARLLWRSGSLPVLATVWIHAQAFRLWKNGAKFHPHP